MKTVQEIINTDYHSYGVYVIEGRAIPSMIDGLKPSQRKALFCAIKSASSFIKTAALTGETLKNGYHHGDASMNGTINGLTATFSNNVPLLEGEGSFGNKFDPTPAAARYTKVKLSKNFKRFFTDNEILLDDPDPEVPEPQYYLPLIPWVLVNGIKGIAVGFATEIQPHCPKDIARACIRYLEYPSGALSEPQPSFPDFSGATLPVDNKWMVRGVFERKGSSSVLVTELTPRMTRDQFISHLHKLEDQGKIISHTDKSSMNDFHFEIKFKRGQLPKEDEKVFKLLKLQAILNENITVLDENKKVRVYDSKVQLLKDFVDFRVKTIEKRYESYILRDELDLSKTSELKRFIQLVIDGVIVFKGKTKDQLRKILKGEHSFQQEMINPCLSVNVYQFCQDEIDKLQEKIDLLKKDIITWQNIKPKVQYRTELKELLK